MPVRGDTSHIYALDGSFIICSVQNSILPVSHKFKKKDWIENRSRIYN